VIKTIGAIKRASPSCDYGREFIVFIGRIFVNYTPVGKG